MDTKYMGNSKTNEPYKLYNSSNTQTYFFLKFKYLLHMKNIKTIYNNDNLKITGPTCGKIEVPGSS